MLLSIRMATILLVLYNCTFVTRMKLITIVIMIVIRMQRIRIAIAIGYMIITRKSCKKNIANITIAVMQCAVIHFQPTHCDDKKILAARTYQ